MEENQTNTNVSENKTVRKSINSRRRTTESSDTNERDILNVSAKQSSSSLKNNSLDKEVNSTQSSGKDESDHSSRFYFGYIVQIKNEANNEANEYLLTRRIGKGGFSEVRLGKLRLDRSRRFAVKVVDLKKPKVQRIGRQPHWEIDLLKKLDNSELVIQMFDYRIIEDDCIFMVLELGGQSLDMLHKVGRRGKSAVKPSQCRKRFKQCTRCVQQVHAFDVLHCDVKPNNFIRVGNLLKIIDFGCATPLGPLNEAVLRKKSLGTTRFMSPEYLRDKIASKGLDVWSLGCTLYWLLTGQKVYREPKYELRKAISTKLPDLTPIADPDAKDLLSKIFIQDFRARPTCTDILKHKYFSRPESPKPVTKKASKRSNNRQNSKE